MRIREIHNGAPLEMGGTGGLSLGRQYQAIQPLEFTSRWSCVFYSSARRQAGEDSSRKAASPRAAVCLAQQVRRRRSANDRRALRDRLRSPLGNRPLRRAASTRLLANSGPNPLNGQRNHECHRWNMECTSTVGRHR